jgi:tungstate transport system permease protein
VDLIRDAIRETFLLLLQGDSEIWSITLRTLIICGCSTIVSFIVGASAGFCLAVLPFRGRGVLVTFANTGMGMPPVIAGLLVAVLLWRSGPLGGLNLIYTPVAMIISQCVIAIPLVAAITAGSFMSLPESLFLQIRSLGAGRKDTLFLLAYEARLGLMVAMMAGFGAVISEVGAAMMVGGNLAGDTRVLTTATVLLVSKGEFGRALAYGIVLLAMVFIVALVLTSVQNLARKRV